MDTTYDADGLSGQFRDRVERIGADRKHGASWLAREAARALADAATAAGAADAAGTDADRLAQIHALARELALVRPSMAAIANTVAHVWWAGNSAEPAQRLAAIQQAARDVEARWGASVDGMTQWAGGAIQGVVYTLSRSGSVEETLTTLARERQQSSPLRVIVSESRPGAEGVALAKALAAAGAQVTLVADGACATFIEEAALVIVGADSVRADGAVINKLGTHTLALVAYAAGKPVYALAESLKVTPSSYPLVIEEMPPDELLAEPVAGITPRNLYFDVTPANLITGVVTESGLLEASGLARLAAQAERAYQSLMRQ